MAQYIDKDALVVKIDRRMSVFNEEKVKKGASQIDKLSLGARIAMLEELKTFINTLEVRDPYEQWVQHDSIKSGIQAHADTYSFNIESELFNQLTKEQQKLWRKEIEQAVISGGGVGVELARDARYKENLEVKEVNLQEEIDKEWEKCNPIDEGMGVESAFIHVEAFDMIAKHFFELGLKAQKGE